MKTRFLTILAVTLALSCIPPTRAQDAQPTQAEESAALIATIQSTDASLHAKSVACKRLAFIGGVDAIPALVALLPHERLSHYARYGLEGIPDPAAAAALREATKSLTGRQLIGVVGSLGSIRDGESVELLGSLLKNKDVQVAIAAASSLGKIGNEAAMKALKAGELGSIKVDAVGRRALADACIECSEQLFRKKDRSKAKEAIELAVSVYADEDSLPQPVKAAVTRALILVADPNLLADRIISILKADDPEIDEILLHTAREFKSERMVAIMITLYDHCDAEMRIQLLRYFGEGGKDYPFFDLRIQILFSAWDDSPELQLEVTRIISRMGDVLSDNEFAINTLMMQLESKDKALRAVTIDTLDGQSSKAINARLLDRFESADVPVRARLAMIELLGRRRVTGVASQLAALAASAPDRVIRLAAVRAFGETVALADIDRLLDLYATFQADEESAGVFKESVQAAFIRMPDLDATVDRLVASITGKSADVQVFTLDRIGELGGATALKQIGELAIQGEPHLQDAATRILGAWMTSDAAPVLLELAKTHPAENLRIRTLRGFIRIVRQLKFSNQQRLAYCKEAIEVAHRPEEKRLAIETLTRIVSAASMRVALEHLGDPDLKEQAAKTILKLAEPLSEKSPAPVVDALKKIVSARVSTSTTRQAELLIARIEQR